MAPPHIRQVDFGDGSAGNLGRQFDSYAAISMEVPWALTRERLGRPPREIHLIESLEFNAVESLAKSLAPVEAVVGIGGGQAMDAAKYVAWKRGLKLALIPTIVSTDAFATPAAGLRRNGKVEYLGEAKVDRLVIDYGLIRTAPKALNISGAGDILSCHTACFDWKLAWERGQEPLGYDETAARRSLALVDRIDRHSDAIRDVLDEGLRALVDCEIEIVEICIGAGGPGHFRSEEGSEHFFFYNVEHRTGRPFIHGWIVGLGIFLMSRLQENRAEFITDLMDRIDLPYRPRDLKLTRQDATEALLTLRAQTRADRRWWSIIEAREIGAEFVEAALKELRW